jgi:hypothetical protein
MGIEPIIKEVGELESDTAGDPNADPSSGIYAARCPRSRQSCPTINDIDAGLAALAVRCLLRAVGPFQLHPVAV